MFSKIFRRTPASPLHDFLVSSTPERVAAICEKSSESPDFIPITIGMVIVSTAGHFSRDDAPLVKGSFAKTSKDVIAFEALAFSAFAVREYYHPIDSDYGDEAVTDSFKDGFGFCRAIIKRELGSAYKEVFDRRLMEYAQANHRDGMKGAADCFRVNLQSIKGASVPQAKYDGASFDLSDTVHLMAITNAFAATMPKASAESLHAIADHYGFF